MLYQFVWIQKIQKNLLKQLNEDENITVIMVTHEEEMASFANRIIYFRDGHIEDSLKKGFK